MTGFRKRIALVLGSVFLVTMFTAFGFPAFPPAFAHAQEPGQARAEGPLSAGDPSSSPSAEEREADGEELYILVNPHLRELWVMLGEIPLKRYPIALGKPRTPTPVGEFRVINKYRNWGSGFGTRWIGLDVPWGTYGIHGTNRPHTIGTHASHGCIRMFNRHVEEIYEWVEVGTRVVILGHVLRAPDLDPRDLARGDAGGDVLLVQNRLLHGGYYSGPCHGRFNRATEAAVRAFERDRGLPVDGVIHLHDYIALGLVE